MPKRSPNEVKIDDDLRLRVRSARTSNGLTQRQLADGARAELGQHDALFGNTPEARACRPTQGTISKIESGRQRSAPPELHTFLVRFAKLPDGHVTPASATATHGNEPLKPVEHSEDRIGSTLRATHFHTDRQQAILDQGHSLLALILDHGPVSDYAYRLWRDLAVAEGVTLAPNTESSPP